LKPGNAAGARRQVLVVSYRTLPFQSQEKESTLLKEPSDGKGKSGKHTEVEGKRKMCQKSCEKTENFLWRRKGGLVRKTEMKTRTGNHTLHSRKIVFLTGRQRAGGWYVRRRVLSRPINPIQSPSKKEGGEVGINEKGSSL